jgi:4-aminobutyrate aminotransferase-like enzyme
MPLSAVVGRREVMEVFDKIFFSGTFGGEALSLAACRATILEMESRNAISQIDAYGRGLMAGIQDLVNRYALQEAIVVRGLSCRSIVEFCHEDEFESRIRRTFFLQECVKRGLLYFGIHLPTAAHGERELDFTMAVLSEVIPLFAAAHQVNDFAARLEARVVEPIFRRA